MWERVNHLASSDGDIRVLGEDRSEDTWFTASYLGNVANDIAQLPRGLAVP